MYHKARGSMWFEDEIQYTADLPDYESISAEERHFIELILGFFAVSDRIVLANLVENFIREVEIPEAKLFYNFQAAMEDIHSLTYTNHLVTLVKDQRRIGDLMDSVNVFPSVGAKAAWARKWMSRDRPLAERIIAFAVVEAVYFSASFCAIFWFKTRNKFVKGIGVSNEFISRDENLHADFACMLYKNYFPRVSDEVIHEIIRDAVEVEETFVCEILPGTGFVGMTAPLMTQYVHFVADRLAQQLGCSTLLWGAANPFEFMAILGMPGKSNFFEKRVTEYSKVSSASLVDFSVGGDDF
jgi:ribonucleotide reductase beta subunit family protein with ferritin-like domain